jgi:hypothetical protein
VELVKMALASFGAGSAAGLFGYRPFLLQQCARAESFSFLGALTSAVNLLADGRAPQFLQPYLAGGVSIALAKPNSGVRPLCCGDPIRRLVGKCFCIGGKDEISAVFKNKNFGVGCPGGVEVVAHSLRDCLSKHAGSGLGLLKIDFRNAFNLIDRGAFVNASCSMFPGLSKWTMWCYGSPSILLYDHKDVINSTCGVQQGDPLGPLYFCCGLASLVSEIEKLGPVYNKWYMDDGGIIGNVEMLQQVWDLLATEGPKVGLNLNPSKCEWSWLDSGCSAPCPIRVGAGRQEDQISFVPTGEIQMLGVPLGSCSNVAEYVGKKLFSRLKLMVDRLVDFDDSQSAFFLLRVSFSIVRATHFMRTTPAQWSVEAAEFDATLRRAAESILGFPFSDQCYAQAALTPRLGGFGMRRIVDHSNIAFTASWYESRSTCGEKWELRATWVPRPIRSRARSSRTNKFLNASLTKPRTLGNVSAFVDWGVSTPVPGFLQFPRFWMGQIPL